MTQPKVSALFTVYNKAGYLAATIASVRAQMPDEAEIEYVFADDVSTDKSLDVIEAAMIGAPNVQIIRNSKNRGPSVRLNQAARAATGQYLYFLDADDLAAPGTIPAMLGMLTSEDADLIYGKTEKKVLGLGEAPPAADAGAGHEVSDKPFEMILGGGFVRMALMCERELFLIAGGADERIFIQDESLPLRLGLHARRLIDWQGRIVYRQPDPEGGTHISSNRDQLQHDAFLAAANMLDDLPDKMSQYAPALYARVVSQYWKMKKRHGALPLVSSAWRRYQATRGGAAQPDAEALASMRADFAAMENVRKMPKT